MLPQVTHHLFLPAQEKRKVGLSVVWASYPFALSFPVRFSELRIIPAEGA